VFVGLFALLGVTALGLLLLVALARAVSLHPEPLPVLPFQSGHRPSEHALSRFHVRWYPATLVFLAFDVEMLFMYPWAVVVAELGASAAIEMFVFLGALFVAVGWAWREGALRWV
jgi:NADH:ubiquinone oxidoreductase subunit 3 (subunit A)